MKSLHFLFADYFFPSQGIHSNQLKVFHIKQEGKKTMKALKTIKFYQYFLFMPSVVSLSVYENLEPEF